MSWPKSECQMKHLSINIVIPSHTPIILGEIFNDLSQVAKYCDLSKNGLILYIKNNIVYLNQIIIQWGHYSKSRNHLLFQVYYLINFNWRHTYPLAQMCLLNCYELKIFRLGLYYI
jgi:hypothetical protein